MQYRKGMNWSRYLWLTMRHYERVRSFWARSGRFTLCEMAWKNVNHYRAQLGLPASED